MGYHYCRRLSRNDDVSGYAKTRARKRLFRETHSRVRPDNVYANYHFPRTSKRRCYYYSCLTGEISKTVRMYIRLSESVSLHCTRLPQNNYCFIGEAECISPLLYGFVIKRYSHFYLFGVRDIARDTLACLQNVHF